MHLNRGPVSLKRKFENVFLNNLFHGESSKSGNGSSKAQTAEIAGQLPALISGLGIQSILDIPCGDLEWMKDVDLGTASYIGADISPSLISHLTANFPNKQFQLLNVTKDLLPKVDLIFCRDLFVHLSDKDIQLAINKIKQSGSKYLATTTFSERTKNKNLKFFTREIGWRTLNLEVAPFNFPPALIKINERCTEGAGTFSDKALGLWEIGKLD